jgi:acyl carrier protein
VDRNELLGIMRGYFEGKSSPEVLADFAAVSPRSLLKESLDVVEFVLHLEDELGREIDLARLGGALQHESFGALAAEASGWLAEE